MGSLDRLSSLSVLSLSRGSKRADGIWVRGLSPVYM